jgi:hypothetical protein
VPPRVKHRILPPSQGGLQGCHVFSGAGSHLPVREGSNADTYVVASDPLGGPWCATCQTAPDPASLQGGLRAVTLPTVLCEPLASSIKKSLAGLPVQ